VLLRLYIQAWASALLVLTDRAMPEPLRVGRVTGKIPTLFCILAVIILLTALLGSRRRVF
jgi:sorbitol-specific phosphotransferase system component IIC